MNVITYFSKLISPDMPKANENELTLEYYELWISDGIYSALHRDFRKITEIYVPELRLAINMALPPVNVFLVDYDRYSNKVQTMSGKDVKLIKTVIISKNSEAAKTLLWLEDCLKNKKEKEKSLKQLFDVEDLEKTKK